MNVLIDDMYMSEDHRQVFDLLERDERQDNNHHYSHRKNTFVRLHYLLDRQIRLNNRFHHEN